MKNEGSERSTPEQRMAFVLTVLSVCALVLIAAGVGLWLDSLGAGLAIAGALLWVDLWLMTAEGKSK